MCNHEFSKCNASFNFIYNDNQERFSSFHFPFHFPYTAVQLVMCTFSIINKATVRNSIMDSYWSLRNHML
jgi:hypothetical protein